MVVTSEDLKIKGEEEEDAVNSSRPLGISSIFSPVAHTALFPGKEQSIFIQCLPVSGNTSPKKQVPLLELLSAYFAVRMPE